MKITEDVRKYAAEQGVSEQEALIKGPVLKRAVPHFTLFSFLIGVKTFTNLQGRTL